MMTQEQRERVERSMGLVIGNRYLRHPGNRFERDDLMAAGFLALCESSVRYTGQNGSTFTSFAFFRVNGAIRDCLRKRQTHEELEPYYDELTLDNFESTSATFLDVNEVIASKLSPQQKVVVELRLKGWKNHEIAEHLGKTEVRTSQVFKFALDRLRGAL